MNSATATSRSRSERKVPPLGLGLLALVIGLVILWLSPVVTYECRGGDAGAHCTIERRLGGLIPVERLEIDGIAHAEGRVWETRSTSRKGGKTKRKSKTHSRVELTSASGVVLYDAETGGTVGTAAPDVAARIQALVAQPQGASFHVWHVSLVPALFATFALLIGLPTISAQVAETAGFDYGGRVGFAVVALALGAGWVLALLGSFPA